LCIKTVGALLINAMLVVPAATAANLSRNMRQMFWWTIALSVVVGVVGLYLSFAVHLPIGNRELDLGSGGVIVCMSGLLFFASIPARWLRDRTRERKPAAALAGAKA